MEFDIMPDNPTKRCRSCGASIVWIKTVGGKYMPCDATPVSYKTDGKGDSKVVTTSGIVISCEIITNPSDAEYGKHYGFIPHWSTCNAPDSFRKRG